MDYPWRKDRTPYKVLISEVLLIRTKAPQVMPVFNKFIKKYPNLKDFFEINFIIVEGLIKSLGLLFRARMLENLANDIKNKFDRKIPNFFPELKSLKGIGDYNANAVLCFGFNQKRPLLDSNFIRIYKRVFNVSSVTKTAKTDKYLWKFSETILPDDDYVTFNYGILDLGGIICLSRTPKCKSCFLTEICVYFKKRASIDNKF